MRKLFLASLAAASLLTAASAANAQIFYPSVYGPVYVPAPVYMPAPACWVNIYGFTVCN